MTTGLKFTLLTHTKEISKRSNTGRVVVDLLGDAAEQVLWDRTIPPARLVQEIDAGGVALVYPGTEDELGGDLTGIRHFILIDSTWQEARKIHQRSPYLQKARRISLKTEQKSEYSLRKNQKISGLCTVECVVEILRSTGQVEKAEQLHACFLTFMKQSGAKPAISREPMTASPLLASDRLDASERTGR
jgi:DTW domain-containing protein YfiP